EPRRERLRAQRTAEVAGARGWVGDGAVERGLDRVRGAREVAVAAPLAEPREQHRGGTDQRGRVRLVLAGDVGRRAVLGLGDAVVRAGVDRGRKPEAAGNL